MFTGKTKWQLLWEFFKEHRLAVFLTLAAGMFSHVLALLILLSIGRYYDFLFGISSKKGGLLDIFFVHIGDSVLQFLFVFFLLVGGKIATSFFEHYRAGVLGESISAKLREMLFAHQLRVPMSVYDQKGVGKYLLRYSGDLKSIQQYVTKGLLQFISDFALLVLFLGAIALLWPQIFLVFLASIPLVLAAIIFLNRSFYSISVQRRDTMAGLLAFVNTRLLGALTIKSFNKEVSEVQKFEKGSRKLFLRGKRYRFLYSILYAVIPELLYVMVGIVLLLAYTQKQSGAGSLAEGALITSLLLIITMLPVLRRVLRVNVIWKLGDISFTKLLAILHIPAEAEGKKLDLSCKDGEIEFRNVTFGYERDKLLFQNVTFTIAPHAITLITGGIGSGKTTMIKLLNGIYLPLEGSILIDGQDIGTVYPKSLRKKIAIVSEEWPLVGKTVFEAISYSTKSEKREIAAKMLQEVQSGISPEGRISLDNPIGDLGANLSSGQKKILMYARVFLTRKPILLIDEPFVGLDAQSCATIAALLEELKSKRTILIFSKDPIESWLKVNQEIVV